MSVKQSKAMSYELHQCDNCSVSKFIIEYDKNQRECIKNEGEAWCKRCVVEQTGSVYDLYECDACVVQKFIIEYDETQIEYINQGNMAFCKRCLIK